MNTGHYLLARRYFICFSHRYIFFLSSFKHYRHDVLSDAPCIVGMKIADGGNGWKIRFAAV